MEIYEWHLTTPSILFKLQVKEAPFWRDNMDKQLIRCNRKREAKPSWVKGLELIFKSTCVTAAEALPTIMTAWCLSFFLLVLAGLMAASWPFTWGGGLDTRGYRCAPVIYVYVFNKIKRPIYSHLKSCLHSDFYILQWVSAFGEYPWNFPKQPNGIELFPSTMNHDQ